MIQSRSAQIVNFMMFLTVPIETFSKLLAAQINIFILIYLELHMDSSKFKGRQIHLKVLYWKGS